MREVVETVHQPFAGAVNIPLSQLRSRWQELPSDRTILVLCQVGVRGYNATRFLCNMGLDARNLSGGCITMSLGS